jgi:hypothetical protein
VVGGQAEHDRIRTPNASRLEENRTRVPLKRKRGPVTSRVFLSHSAELPPTSPLVRRSFAALSATLILLLVRRPPFQKEGRSEQPILPAF